MTDIAYCKVYSFAGLQEFCGAPVGSIRGSGSEAQVSVSDYLESSEQIVLVSLTKKNGDCLGV